MHIITEKELSKCCNKNPKIIRNIGGALLIVQIFCGNEDCCSLGSASGYDGIEVEQKAFNAWNTDKRKYCKSGS